MKWSTLALALLLIGCSDNANRGMSEKERVALANYRAIVVKAMCEPWGEKREKAIADLVNETAYGNVSFGFNEYTVQDLASDVQPSDCANAGYQVEDPKPIDFEAALRRCRRKMPQSLPGDNEAMRAAHQRVLQRRSVECAAIFEKYGQQ